MTAETDTGWKNVGAKLHKERAKEKVYGSGDTLGTSQVVALAPVRVGGTNGNVMVHNGHISATVTVKVWVSDVYDSPGDPINNPTNWKQIGSDLTATAGGSDYGVFGPHFMWMCVTAVSNTAGTYPVYVRLYCAQGV